MRQQLIKALLSHAHGEIEYHKANVNVYLNNPAGIGEHSDIIEAIGNEIDKMARYHDQVEVLKRYFVTIVDKDSNSINMDLVFMAVKKNLIGAVSPGSSGGSAISDSDIDAAKMLGALEFDIGNGDNTVDIGQAKITHAAGASGNAATTALPIFLQAEDGSTSVYFSGITRGTPNHGQTDDLEFAFHIDY